MSPIRLYSIIAIMSLALLGIIGIQVSLLKRSLEANRANFEAGVNDALHEVVSQMEAQRMKTHVVSMQDRVEVIRERGPMMGRIPMDLRDMTADVEEIQMFEWRDSMELVFETDSGVHRKPSTTVVWMSGSSIRTEAEDQILRVEIQGDPGSVNLMKSTLEKLEGMAENTPIRVDTTVVEDLLTRKLKDQGLDLDYEFQVYLDTAKNLMDSYASLLSKETSVRHEIELFPNLSRNNPPKLVVLFPGESSYLFQSIWREAAGSLLFSTIILLCFGLTVWTIFRQKRLSEMKNDFINNMTHELKTPIATIGLAAESLAQQRHQADPAFIERYTGIIREENKRINQQVERVLQAAQFDKQEIELNKTTVEMKDLLAEAIRHYQLQVEERGGSLSLDLEGQPVIRADRDHLLHVVTNLLDNANKYSPGSPQITVSCKQRKGWTDILVTDRGKGISKSNQQAIFKRFYRESTGMLHEVKGFGLGLSYVREVVEAHGGEVSVSSKMGEGSTFTVSIPNVEVFADDTQFTS